MKILFTGKNHSQGLKDLDPSSLSGVAQSLGYVLANSLDEAPDVVVCVDFHNSALPIIRQAKSRKIPTVLVINEPEVVIPEHSQVRILKEFDKVLKVGRPDSPEALKWPQTWLPITSNNERQDRVVLVNADKWSFVRGQHYWLRAATSSQFGNVDVFGFGWERTAWVRLAHRIFELLRTIASSTWPDLRGVTRQAIKIRAIKAGKTLELVQGMGCLKGGGIQLHGMQGGITPGAATSHFFHAARMGSRVGAEKKPGVSAGGRLHQRLSVRLTL